MADEYTVARHLSDKEPIVEQVYQALLDAVREFGPVAEAAKKTSIHLDNKSGFAGIYTRKSYILLHFRTEHPIESQRIQKREQLSKRRFKHTVKLASKADIDQELLGWLHQAYELSA